MSAFILKRGAEYYQAFTTSVDGPKWTRKIDEAYRFSFRSVAQNVLTNDERVSGAEIVELK